MQVGADKWVLPAAFMHRAEDVYNMPTRKTDIWVVSYPRSGKISYVYNLSLIVNDY